MRDTVDFLLRHWLHVDALSRRERFAEHTWETFAAVLDTCERIARDRFAPFNRRVDIEEPRIEPGPDGERVVLPAVTQAAWDAYAASGMLSAAQDLSLGGMQLPYTVEAAANAFFAKASVSIGAGMLTVGNANLLMAHGTERQRQVFAMAEFEGRWSGTMCLSEPQAGSSLGDISTRAVPDAGGLMAWDADPLGPRYRLRGSKMWISAGEHELTENIVHLVLAKIPGPDGRLVPGTRGISLFVVPKRMVDAQGRLTGERNDVALAGLNHKCGWRGTTNTLLNFGEGRFRPRTGAGDGLDGQGAGAVGWLVGRPGEGLRCMFHMMNEARIGVGMAAAMLGMAGYEASLAYARQRPQGRPATDAGKDVSQPQIPIIEHADVRRMLLAQKAYCEGSLALALYCARLVDEQRTGDASAVLPSGRTVVGEAALLLEVLTPIAKSWPSEWCLEANSLAIQVHGGYGYTRDFPVEQYWRDNRLNMIHEGTHGIQALDLLGRKVVMEGGAGLELLAQRIHATIEVALQAPTLAGAAHVLAGALHKLRAATKSAWATGVPQEALANATPYLQAFGHVVLAWIWMDVALAVCPAQGPSPVAGTPAPVQGGMAVATLAGASSMAATVTPMTEAFAQGKLAAMRYFFAYELPRIDAWLKVVAEREAVCRTMDPHWF